MDRQIVYAGSIPLDTDLLTIQRNVQVALGALAEAVLGGEPLIDGLAITPGAAPYSVRIGIGSLTQRMVNDFSAFGALPADGSAVVRTALLREAAELVLGPPPDPAHVTVWLIQAVVAEVDTGPVALPYWNAADPGVMWTGPGNSGLAQNTVRRLQVRLGVKASGPQVLAGAVPPAPDEGWIGLHAVVTVAGKPAIDPVDLQPWSGSPRLRYPLTALPPAATQCETFTADAVWRVPYPVRWVRVRLAGAGGGGGGGETSYSGGGGGAGGYAEAVVPVVAGQSIPITVGRGGAGGGPGAVGLPGGGSAFGAMLSASGGQGGGSNDPDSHGGSPGEGLSGRLTLTGGYGGDGARMALIPAGNGGASAFGGGGRGANEGGAPAFGLAPGSGGGGGYGVSALGGQGASGIVILEY